MFVLVVWLWRVNGVTHRCAFARFYKKWGKRL